MRPLARLLGLTFITACATGGASVPSLLPPLDDEPSRLVVTNRHDHSVLVFVQWEEAQRRLGRVEDASSETFSLSPYLNGRLVRMAVRCPTHGDTYTTQEVVVSPGLSIVLSVERLLGFSTVALR